MPGARSTNGIEENSGTAGKTAVYARDLCTGMCTKAKVGSTQTLPIESDSRFVPVIAINADGTLGDFIGTALTKTVGKHHVNGDSNAHALDGGNIKHGIVTE